MGAADQQMCLRAEALFASFMQPSDRPTPGQVRMAVAVSLVRFGARGCAERTASEFGADPPSAVARMQWAVAAVQAAFALPSQGRPEVRTAWRPEQRRRSLESLRRKFVERVAEGGA